MLATGLAGFGLTAAGFTVAVAQVAGVFRSAATSWASPPTAVPELALGPIPSITSWREISLPVDSFRESSAARNTVLTAEYQLTKSCMARYGLTFDSPVWTTPATNSDYYRLFGLLDLVHARKYGYHTGERLLSDGEAAPQPGVTENPSESAPNYLAVVMGDPPGRVVNGRTVPPGGCIGAARSKLGDSSKILNLKEEAIGYGLSQSNADPRVIKAFASWSACMQKAGFSYANPTEANNDWNGNIVTAVEKRAATADVSCKVTTNLTGLRVAVASAWQKKFIRTHATQFAAMRPEIDDQVARAKSVLPKD